MFTEPTGGDRIWLTTLKNSKLERARGADRRGRGPLPHGHGGGRPGAGLGLFLEERRRRCPTDRRGLGAFCPQLSGRQTWPPVTVDAWAGFDIYPAAATDAAGRVWVAWQAFRNGQVADHGGPQEGDGFAAPWVVAETPANAWCPAIAATSSQPAEVTIAWDTYAKGDYDVYARTYHGDSPAEPFPVAATQGFEARPAVAGRRQPPSLDGVGTNRTGVWGKDYSGDAEDSLTKKGLPLYLQAARRRSACYRTGNGPSPLAICRRLWPKHAPWKRVSQHGRKGPRPVSWALGTDRGGRVWLSARVWMGPAAVSRTGTSWSPMPAATAGLLRSSLPETSRDARQAVGHGA